MDGYKPHRAEVVKERTRSKVLMERILRAEPMGLSDRSLSDVKNTGGSLSEESCIKIGERKTTDMINLSPQRLKPRVETGNFLIEGKKDDSLRGVNSPLDSEPNKRTKILESPSTRKEMPLGRHTFRDSVHKDMSDYCDALVGITHEVVTGRQDAAARQQKLEMVRSTSNSACWASTKVPIS